MTQIKNYYRDSLAHEIQIIRNLSYINQKDELVKAMLTEVQATAFYTQEQSKVREQQKAFRENNQLEKIFASKKDQELMYYTETENQDPDLSHPQTKIYFSLKQKNALWFALLKMIEEESNKNSWSNLEIHIINNFDSTGNQIRWKSIIPFTGIPPTDEQNEDKYDLTISQLLDPDVFEKHREKFGDFNTYSGNSWYDYQNILSEINANQCSWLNEWAEYILKDPEKAWFFYHQYTTYGSLYDMTHDDPTNKPELFQSLFDQFLQEKNIKLLIDQKEITREHLKKLYSLNKKMWL